MRSTSLLPAHAPLPRLAVAGEWREARNLLCPHPWPNWRPRHQQTLGRSPYQSRSVKTPWPGNPAKSTSCHRRPRTPRRRSSPLCMWRTHTPPPKTCDAPKNSPVIIASYSDSEATEEWHERMDVMNIFKVRFVVKSSVPITWTYLCELLVHCSPIFCFRWNVRFTYVPCHLYSAGCFHVHIKRLNIHFQCCPWVLSGKWMAMNLPSQVLTSP